MSRPGCQGKSRSFIIEDVTSFDGELLAPEHVLSAKHKVLGELCVHPPRMSVGVSHPGGRAKCVADVCPGVAGHRWCGSAGKSKLMLRNTACASDRDETFELPGGCVLRRHLGFSINPAQCLIDDLGLKVEKIVGALGDDRKSGADLWRRVRFIVLLRTIS